MGSSGVVHFEPAMGVRRSDHRDDRNAASPGSRRRFSSPKVNSTGSSWMQAKIVPAAPTGGSYMERTSCSTGQLARQSSS